MSLQSVRSFLSEHAPDIQILEAPTSTATVMEAAAVHGVAPGQIAKTLSLRLKDEVILLVVGGDARIDNRKYKDRFGAKAVMIGRAYLWGLAANGQPGVENVLDILRGGIDACLLGLGKSSIGELSADDIVVPPDFFLTLGDK